MLLWVFLADEGCTDEPPAPDVLLQIESDTYWCFSVLMDYAKGLFDDFGQGLTRMINQVDVLLQLQDKTLYDTFLNAGCNGGLYGIRWIVCLLTRELPGEVTARLWDRYIAYGEGFLRMHACVCVSLLGCEEWQDTLKTLNEDTLLPWLLHLPTDNWGKSNIDRILVRAYKLSCLESAVTLLPHLFPLLIAVSAAILLIVTVCAITLMALSLLYSIMM